ncbi:MAG: phytanoyl-CoA dioxygenase family protein [Firmicutes bacterium]|nr:phytanoyl-CoA dioxygenase family protein [Bacillota bacterium]
MRAAATEEEIAFYRTNGFVQLNNVLSQEEITRLAKAMDEAMEEARRDDYAVHSARSGPYYRVLNQKVNVWRDHGGIAQVTCSPELASLARQLAGVSGIRLFHDHLLWKMPGDSKPTPWHQDLPYWPMEAPDALSFWIPVHDVDEHNGAMMFVPKSQAAGKLKSISLAEPEDLMEYARAQGFQPERPLIARLSAGSITAHSGLTFHYAHANQSERPRKVLAIIYMPDGTVYTGKSHVVTDGYDLVPGQPFRGGRFPQLA